MYWLSLWSGLCAGVLWTIGDMLLVGFDNSPEEFASYYEQMGRDRRAIYALGASERRLRWGALVAQFSSPLLLGSLYAYYHQLRTSEWAWLVVLLLAAGFMCSPLAHGSFYYAAAVHNVLWRMGGTVPVPLKQLAQDFERIKHQAWVPAVLLTASGWLLHAWLLVTGHGAGPWYIGLASPLWLSLGSLVLLVLPYPGRPLLHGAMLNIGTTVAFAIWLIGAWLGGYGV